MIEVKFTLMLVIGIVHCGSLSAKFPSIIENQGEKEYTDSKRFQGDLPFTEIHHLTMKIYFFNVTNSEDVVNKKAKPDLQEVGPYVYTELRKKENITWHEEDKSVSYQEHIIYKFDEVESKGSESDQITIPNVPLLSVLHIAKQNNIEDKISLVAQLPKETLYVTQRVDELLFKGKESELLKTLEQLEPFLPPGATFPNPKFGLMVDRNDTTEEYRVYTGDDDPDKFAQIKTWKNMATTKYWKGETCNMINGTDGMQFAPFVNKNTRLYLLDADICRSVYLDYQTETEHEGIFNYRFGPTTELFANPSVNTDNTCFCVDNQGCPLTGLLGISPCRSGAPIHVGGAHFLMAEPILKETVEGMDPKPELHKSFIDVEPTTGHVMSTARRMQVNIEIQPSNHDFIYRLFSLPRMMHPIMWQDEEITNDRATFKDMLHLSK